MDDPLKRIVSLGFGAMSYSREKLSEQVKTWVEERKVNASESKQLLEDLIARGEQERAALSAYITEQIGSTLERAVPSVYKKELEELRQEVSALRQSVFELRTEIYELKHPKTPADDGDAEDASS